MINKRIIRYSAEILIVILLLIYFIVGLNKGNLENYASLAKYYSEYKEAEVNYEQLSNNVKTLSNNNLIDGGNLDITNPNENKINSKIVIYIPRDIDIKDLNIKVNDKKINKRIDSTDSYNRIVLETTKLNPKENKEYKVEFYSNKIKNFEYYLEVESF